MISIFSLSHQGMNALMHSLSINFQYTSTWHFHSLFTMQCRFVFLNAWKNICKQCLLYVGTLSKNISSQYHIKWWSCFCSIFNDVWIVLPFIPPSFQSSAVLSVCGVVGENINIIDDEPLVSIYGLANKLEIARKYFRMGKQRKMFGGKSIVYSTFVNCIENFRSLRQLDAWRWVSIFSSQALSSYQLFKSSSASLKEKNQDSLIVFPACSVAHIHDWQRRWVIYELKQLILNLLMRTHVSTQMWVYKLWESTN